MASIGDPVRGGRISRVSPGGVVTTVVRALPSSQTSPALGSLVSGVSSVAFIGHQLYALLSGAGCAHGVPDVPNGIIKVGHHGTWKLIANLSAFQAAHPVAHPDPGDFDPDGTWYSMISIGRARASQLALQAARPRAVLQPGPCLRFYQPSSLSRLSSMPKWWAISWMTVRRTWLATSCSVRQIAQIAWR